ncbi:MAG: peptidoglycan DD-metalloendopeptidase family protein [Oscillospiraceae bacterium]|nr:peptidoglycan DD-metalloendopeptidase family protein [Oscillospiraceae bacterium]
MNNKRFVRIMAIVLAFVMLLSVAMIAISALTGASASARVTQAQIDALRRDRDELARQRREIQSRINAIEFEHMTELSKKEILDERIINTGLEIENVVSTIAYFDLLIREKEYEVYLAQDRENTQLEKYRTRVRNMEENGVISYLEIIFDSTSFPDMLARIDAVADIMRADEAVYNDLIMARNETEAAKESLEHTRTEMDEEKARLEEREAELLEQLQEAQEIILRLEASMETERELHAQMREDERNVQAEINRQVAALARQQEAERQRRLREQQQRQQRQTGGGTVVGSGQLVWPVSGSVTSNFGVRRHPVFGDMRFHGGIDIGANHGTSVVAADSGSVIISSYNSSYGNYIVISHGNGMTTLYAHLSTRSVSVGDAVSRGQQIGRVGSTGVSTGPHLHFEVSVNGTRVNPRAHL